MKMIEVYNDNNSLLIDDTYKNLCLTRKLYRSDFSEEKLATGYRYTVKLHEGELMVALSSQSGEFLSFDTSITQESATFWFYEKKDVGLNFDQIPPNIQGFVFGIPSITPSSHGIGIECYNERGEVTFSSKYKYMRVLDYISDKCENKQISGKKIAMVYLNSFFKERIRVRKTAGAGWLKRTYYDSMEGFLEGGTYGCHHIQYTESEHYYNINPNLDGVPNWEAGKPQFLIIDVTGL